MFTECSPTLSKRSVSVRDSLNKASCLTWLTDDAYRTAIRGQTGEIYLEKCDTSASGTTSNDLSALTKGSDEIQTWVEAALGQSGRQSKCRSDLHLRKICLSRQLMRSFEFMDISVLGKLLVARERGLHDHLDNKMHQIENILTLEVIFSQPSMILEDIDDDIADLFLWLSETKQELSDDVPYSDRKPSMEFAEYVLRDFEVHNDIRLSIIKLLNEVQKLNSKSAHDNTSITSRYNMDQFEEDFYDQWLRALEYKLRLQKDTDQFEEDHHSKYSPMVGQEQDLHSELKHNSNRKWFKTKDTLFMGYLPDEDNISYCTSNRSPEHIETDQEKILDSISSFSSTDPMFALFDMDTSSNVQEFHGERRRSQDAFTHGLSIGGSGAYFPDTEMYIPRRSINCHSETLSRPAFLTDEPQFLRDTYTSEILIRSDHYSKESETEDLPQASRSSLEDIDWDINWDYYQVPFYSSEEEDSQIVDLENINEWEPENDSDHSLVLGSKDVPTMLREKMSLPTSGYETSVESDQTICAMSLSCVLQFTSCLYYEIEARMNAVEEHTEKTSTLRYLIRTISECDLTARINLKLIQQLLESEYSQDNCCTTYNGSLQDELRRIDKLWDCMRERCIIKQLELVEDRISYLDDYKDIDELRLSMEILKEFSGIITDIKISLRDIGGENETLWYRTLKTEERLLDRKKNLANEAEIVHHSTMSVSQSKCARKFFSFELHLKNEGDLVSEYDVQEAYDKFGACLASLRKCVENLNLISSLSCQTLITTKIEEEIQSWKDLCVHKSSVFSHTITKKIESTPAEGTLEDRLPSSGFICSSLPMKVILMVIVSMLGLWFNSSFNVFQLRQMLCKDTNDLDPH